MAEMICSECGKSFSATCPACQRASLSSDCPTEPDTEEFFVTFQYPVSISSELDAFDRLHQNVQTGYDIYVDDPY